MSQTGCGSNRFAFSKVHYDYSVETDNSGYKMTSGEAIAVIQGSKRPSGSGCHYCWKEIDGSERY